MTHERFAETPEQKLAAWYLKHIRPLLEQVAPDRVEQLDANLDRIRRLSQQRTEEWTVCLVGDAGVGKSTLLNALVAGHHMLLPQGGIGPLTAQATSIRYAEQPAFHAHYHGADRLGKLLFALESHDKAAKRRHEASSADTDNEATTVEEAARRHISEELQDDESGQRISEYQKQARLMLMGSPNGDLDLEYLIDGLRTCLDRKPLFGRALSPEDTARVDHIRRALALAKQKTAHDCKSASTLDLEFLGALREHATGCLAPMIRQLDVVWPAKFLQDGLVLVDLPGLGVKGDIYKEVTQQFIRDRARAVLMVVDRSGLKESSIDLLRNSGFFARLLHGLDSPDTDPVQLLIAVARVDGVAEDAWAEERALKPGQARRFREHFEEACRAARSLVRDQMCDLLGAMVERGDARLRRDRERVVARVLEQLQVHPLSAPEYRKLLADDEEVRSLLKSPEDSYVPQLASSLQELAAQRRTALEHSHQQAVADFRLVLLADLALMGEQWGDQRAAEEAERLRKELEQRIAPLQLELEHRRGAFREFLRVGLPDCIRSRLKEAETAARDEMNAYLARLGDAPWMTVRAAVRRGGAFNGARNIDIAGELSNLLDEQIGAIWAKSILSELRKRTKEMADDSTAMIDQIVAWAKAQEARVNPKLVEALRDQMRADAKSLATVGKEAIDDLQGRVQKRLHGHIDKHVQTSCESFMASKGSRGTGVKVRMLDFFRDLVPLAIQAAHKPAEGILLRNFSQVEEEITKVYKTRHADPLNHAMSQLVSSHEERVLRSQRRKAVLAQLTEVLEHNPYPPQSGAAASEVRL